MNETELIEKITTSLHQSVDQLDRPVADRLMQARQAALRAAAKREGMSGLSMLGAGLAATFSPARAGLAALAVIALTWGLMHWNTHPTQPESIDLALLVDDAPLSAYTRPDFNSCLNREC